MMVVAVVLGTVVMIFVGSLVGLKLSLVISNMLERRARRQRF